MPLYYIGALLAQNIGIFLICPTFGNHKEYILNVIELFLYFLKTFCEEL